MRDVDQLRHTRERYYSYRQMLDGHLLPALGGLKVREINRGMIKGLLADKRRQATPRTPSGLSARSSR